MQRVGLNLYLQHLKSDLQRLNLQIHMYFLSRTCRKMHECLGKWQYPNVKKTYFWESPTIIVNVKHLTRFSS